MIGCCVKFVSENEQFGSSGFVAGGLCLYRQLLQF